MKKSTLIFNVALGLFCGVLLAGCSSPDEDPNAGTTSESTRPEGMQNAPVTSKDGKDTVGTSSEAKPEEFNTPAKKR